MPVEYDNGPPSPEDRIPRYVEDPTFMVSIDSPHPKDGKTDPSASDLFGANTYTEECLSSAGIINVSGMTIEELLASPQIAKCLVCDAQFQVQVTLSMLPSS